MEILLCGAGGFLGRHLEAALTAAGHRVRRGVRRPTGPLDLAIDYARDLTPEVWVPRLAGVDAVINAVGILGERGGQTFAALHEAAPKALFAACTAAGVRRVIQISALGGDGDGDVPSTPYLRSKRAADTYLQTLPLHWTIVRPSLVYGVDGASSALFRTLASLPLIGLPGRGGQRVQPVHVADLAAAVLALLGPGETASRVLPLVGPAPLPWRDLLGAYRAGLGLGPARFLPLPMGLVRGAAALAERLPQRVFTRANLAMLEQGSTASPAACTALLGRPPRPVAAFITPEQAGPLRAAALLGWLLPLLRLSLALVWIGAGVTSLGLYPTGESLALLARVGLEGPAAWAALYGAALLDLLLGALTLARPGRRLWQAQIALVLLYTLVITLALPELWLQPFGPVLKNLPILAALTGLLAAAPRRSP